MPFPAKADPIKFCKACGAELKRKRFASGRLEDRNVFLRREHCSQSCANTRSEVTKGTHHWRARKHCASSCTDCGTAEDLHVHHLDRDHSNNDPSNLVTLCSSCHLKRHWREDLDKRLAANPASIIIAKCEVCGADFHPSARTVRSCSPACKSELLSRRAVEHFADPANRFRRSSSLNTSGHRGVSWHKGKGTWRAHAKLNGRFVHLGYFAFLGEAVTARAEFDARYLVSTEAARGTESPRPT